MAVRKLQSGVLIIRPLRAGLRYALARVAEEGKTARVDLRGRILRGEISLNRAWQERIFALLILVGISLGILGIYTFHTSPILSFDSEPLPPLSWPNIQRIEHIKLGPTFLKKFPEFFTPKEETNWWQMQERLYGILKGNGSVRVEFLEKSGVTRRVEAEVGLLPPFEVIKKTGLIYLVALIHLISAASIFQKHRSTAGALLAFFLLSTALYFVNAAPVVSRFIVLQPSCFQILIKSLYLSAGGMITLVHFAFVFPRPKEILSRFPALPYIFYSYFLLTVALYFSGVIAFGTAFPFLCLWVLIMIGAFLHSFLREEDLFLRYQIRLSVLAPLIVGSVFVLLNLLPGVLGVTFMTFTHFALFSLILSYSLPAAMDNLALYQERLEMEQAFQREKERTRRDLHDSILNDLAKISVSSEVSLTLFDGDLAGVKDRLGLIKNLARDSSRQLRGFLRVTDESHSSTWEDLCGYLRGYAYELVKHLDLNFDLQLSEARMDLKAPSLAIRVCLYRVFQEAMANVLKHSRADTVKASLSFSGDTLIFAIEDNGTGFDRAGVEEGHYGLKNMERRVEELGGTFALETRVDHGTRIRLQLPLK